MRQLCGKCGLFYVDPDPERDKVKSAPVGCDRALREDPTDLFPAKENIVDPFDRGSAVRNTLDRPRDRHRRKGCDRRRIQKRMLRA